MAQRRADERMAGITAAHRFRLGEQRPGWLAKSKAFSSVMRQERNLEIIKKKSDARRAASEKENAAHAVDLLWIGALWFGAWRAVAASGSKVRSRMATSRDVSNAWIAPTITNEAHRSLNWMAAYLLVGASIFLR